MPSWRSRAQLLDDRAREIPARARGLDLLGGQRDPQLADLRLRVQLSTNSKRPLWRTLLVGALSGVLGGAAVLLVPRWLPGVPSWLSVGVCIVAFVAAITWFRGTRSQALRLAAAAEMFLREGRCPGCAYVLDGVPADEAGLRVCPECGGAWRADRIGSAAAEAPALREYRRRVFQPTQRERWIPGLRGLLVTFDDRGQAVNISNPRLRDLPEADRARLGDDRILRLRRASSWIHRTRGVIIALCITPALFTFGKLLLTPPSDHSALATLTSVAVFAASLVMLVLLLGLMAGMVFGDAGLNARTVARAFIAEGVCAQCLGTLDALDGDEHGVCICPTCGAGWKRDGVEAAG